MLHGDPASRQTPRSANLEAKAEIGVYMGFDQVTGRTLFVLANGAIVPRRPTSQLPSTYVSFNWMPKTFTITSKIPIPSASQSPSQPIANSVIQFPNTPHTTAIDSIIDQIPDPHEPPPPDLLLHPTQQRTFSHAPTIPVTPIQSYANDPTLMISDP